MNSTHAMLTTQLVVAKDLICQRHLDSMATLAMLNALPADLDDDLRASVEEARKSVAAARSDSRREAIARFALARVIVMLERTLASGVQRGSDPPGVSGRARL